MTFMERDVDDCRQAYRDTVMLADMLRNSLNPDANVVMRDRAQRLYELSERLQGAGLTFNELRAANMLRLPHYKTCADWSASDWMTALVGEVGETANILKKVRRGDMTMDEARPSLAREIADIQCYLDLLAYQCGVDLGVATTQKFNEISERVGSDVRLG